MQNNNRNVYIIRIKVENSKVLSDAKKGIVRQGWSFGELDIVNQDYQCFKKIYDKSGLKNLTRRRYNNFAIINEIKIGDICIVPKTSNREFLLGKVKETVRIDEGYNGDFKTYITLEDLKFISYTESNASEKISGTFASPYRSPNNRVFMNSVFEAVDEIISDNYINHKGDTISKIMEDLDDDLLSLSQKIVSKINKWSPHSLEKIIEEMFVSNGFTLEDKNRYDSNGSDVDLEFSLPENVLLSSLINLELNIRKENGLDNEQGFDEKLPRLFIQAKKKEKIDHDIENGLNQLLSDKRFDQRNINILINTSESVSKEVYRKALDNSILIINGEQFARILFQHYLTSKAVDKLKN